VVAGCRLVVSDDRISGSDGDGLYGSS
jgi:hypothetical protein